LLVAALAALLVALVAPASASASKLQESILMDDAELVYGKPDQVDQRLAEAKALGFDRIRVSVYWRLLAPSPDQKQKPAGQYPSSDPRYYGQSKWDRYDRIVSAAAKHGIGVLFSLTGPSPLWTTGKPLGGRDDVEDTWEPNAAEFKDFVQAVATRYSGSYRDETFHPPPVPVLPGTVEQGPVIGRVDHWSVWNEPNHGGWLTPQWLPGPGGKGLVPASPRVYRPLVDAAWAALQATGHGSDVILLGETAPRGLHNAGLTRGIRPIRFIRELYCMMADGHAYTGAQAEARGCPATYDPAAFAAAHPGLFAASGWAHHPYSLTTPPRAPDSSRDDATLSGVPRLVKALDTIFAAYGQSARLPVWLTEYGYQTDPPDPTIGVSLAQQADWLDSATHIAYRNSRIASMAQFLLVDDGPLTKFKPDDPRYWGSFQTGLVSGQGKRKPSYGSWQRPIDVSPRRTRPAGKLRVFGQLRTAPDSQRLTAEIQFRRRGAHRWARVSRVTVGNPRGFLDVALRAKGSGSYRIVWIGAGASRQVAVRVGR
jgi:hypothetical protein